jgi:hypothetical protein
VRIRTRILLFQLVVAAAIVGTAGSVYVAISSMGYYVERVELAHRELAALMELAVDANRHSEQIAELLLVGEEQRPDFEGARSEVRQDFNLLAQLVEDEVEFLRDPVEGGVRREAQHPGASW